ncbi:MAG: hypothetical protein DSZ29_00710 [Aquificaceae bacterium]|nr:MAG: hypothetical protein DSZ29_00710 [Aquificaceae bacterium]
MKGVTIPCKVRLVANRFLTRCTHQYNIVGVLVLQQYCFDGVLNYLHTLKNRRLGLRFEALIFFWLSISPNYEILLQNKQLITEGRTLGEIDFIIKDCRTHQLIHLEVAVKFYLGTEDLSDPYRWFGTTVSDQLGKKVDHLKQHQTQLSNKYPEHFPYPIDARYCLLKGRLFYPDHSSTAPEGIAKYHLKGHWLRSHKTTNDKLKISAIDKQDWLATLSSEQLQHCNILSQYPMLDSPQCYLRLGENKEELERVFILPHSFKFPN